MSRVVHARIDEETESLIADLKQALGENESEIIRTGIRLLWSVTPRRGKRRFIGAGKYASGIGDLATNPKHLEGFGES